MRRRPSPVSAVGLWQPLFFLLAGTFAIACGGAEVPNGGVTVEGGGTGGTSTGGRSSGGTGAGLNLGGDDGGGEAGSAGSGVCTPSDPSCKYVAGPSCGDGEVNTKDEACDDGNLFSGDGCNPSCKVENAATWNCPPTGGKCVSTIVCGDGKKEGAEICDDGNATDAGACNATCRRVNLGWSCEADGTTCTQEWKCGDGNIDPFEVCDDGDELDNGCSADCKTIADDVVCPDAGAPCVAKYFCGDGIVTAALGELCDDGDAVDGNGCTACKPDPLWNCPAGGPCVYAVVCGDGKKEGPEVCDDNNKLDGDGCDFSTSCLVSNPDYDCSDVGKACTNLVVCGDGLLTGTEQCDEGALKDGVGCNADCSGVQAGYVCLRPGSACQTIPGPACPNGVLDAGEVCDDGNATNGDGCSADCKTKTPGYVCSTPGALCGQEDCGDGIRTAGEECDDKNENANDGCSASCQLEAGWVCAEPGKSCTPKCGDGLVRGFESCDLGATPPAEPNGCSATCQLDPGYFCTATPCPALEVPLPTNCGNGVKEGSEVCDDGNTVPFDGCYQCRKDPTCTGGVCEAVCGDGQKFGDEDCDDGNTLNGDGCSSLCKVESGFTCTDFTGAPPDTIDLPVVGRDFVGVNRQASGATPSDWASWQSSTSFHPDFNAQFGAAMRAMVKSTLGSNGKPEWNWVPYTTQLAKPPAAATSIQMPPTTLTQCSCGASVGDAPPACTCSDSTVCYCDNPAARSWQTQSSVLRPTLSVPSRFAQWYTNDPSVNVVKGFTVTLKRDVATGTYAFDSGNTAQNGGKDFMDPFGSTSGQVAATKETMSGCSPDRNVSWTTETHFWFEYAGGERFDFAGDDDTWVFVDGKLVVDLGGLHGVLTGGFTLDADTDGAGPDTANGSAAFTTNMGATGVTTQYPANGTVNLGLTVGGVYELVMFQAERNQCGSNFKVTLKDFNRPKSVCKAECGDGKIVGSEVCDDGVDNVDNTYGRCNTTCTAKQFCGDGQINGGEQCDNGVNTDNYGDAGAGKCAPGCKLPARCGDGTADAAFGEQCDRGANNGDGSYDSCSTSCQRDNYCGDGTTDSPQESCDAGLANGGYGALCGYDCKAAPSCGDGIRNGNEVCDDGINNVDPAAQMSVRYDACLTTCKRGPFCGDATIDAVSAGKEACDAGRAANLGTYAGCKSDCTKAPFCGDGSRNHSSEQCDNGVENVTVGPGVDGYGQCLLNCQLGPYCGDASVNGGELCDKGKALNGTYNSQCAKDCAGLGKRCGDGVIDATFEECDRGDDNVPLSTSEYGKCTIDCALTAHCGDGNLDATFEECDLGAELNVGDYGGCSADCRLAERCGDGVVNGNEQCDLGTDASGATLNKGGYGGCRANCTYDIFCGDGKVNGPSGTEFCDDGNRRSGDGCSAGCRVEVLIR